MHIMRELEPGTACRLEADQVDAVLTTARLHIEEDSGMTGPIRVLGLDESHDRWILEADTRRRPVLRRLHAWQDPADFIQQRRDSYERMWDG